MFIVPSIRSSRRVEASKIITMCHVFQVLYIEEAVLGLKHSQVHWAGACHTTSVVS